MKPGLLWIKKNISQAGLVKLSPGFCRCWLDKTPSELIGWHTEGRLMARVWQSHAHLQRREQLNLPHNNHFLSISASGKFYIVCFIFSGKFSFHPNFGSIKRVTLDWKALRVPVVKAQSARSLGTRRHPQRNITTFKTFIQHMPQTKIQQHLSELTYRSACCER